MASPDGAKIGPPTLIPKLIDPAGVVWAISYPSGWVLRNGVQTNGHAQAMKLVGADIWVQSPEAAKGFNWYRVLGLNRWLNSGTSAEPGGPQPQFPLSAAQLASLLAKLADFQADVAALGV